MNNDVYLFSSESENSFDLKKELEKITDFPVTNNLRTKFDLNEQSCFIKTPFLDENSNHICLEVSGTLNRGFLVSDRRATLYGRFGWADFVRFACRNRGLSLIDPYGVITEWTDKEDMEKTVNSIISVIEATSKAVMGERNLPEEYECSFIDFEKDGYSYERMSKNTILITTPYKYFNGERIRISVLEKGAYELILTDVGETMNILNEIGIADEAKQKAIKKLNSIGIDVGKKGDVWITTNRDGFADAQSRLLRGIFLLESTEAFS
jgi:hypothetical protein